MLAIGANEVLVRQNDMLRRLVRGLNWCIENDKLSGLDCESCPLGKTEGRIEPTCEIMMRELGLTKEGDGE